MHLNQVEIAEIRSAILSIAGPAKFNNLVRQYSDTVAKGKLKFWQQELLDGYLRQTQTSISALSLYTQVFREAVLESEPEKPFVYPSTPADALCLAIARSDLAKTRECFELRPRIVDLLAEQKLPTWIICEAGKHASPEIVRLLFELGCDLNQSDSNGFTGLCWAVAAGRYDVAKAFLQLGADPNKGAPLFALFQDIPDRVSMAKLLVEYGANPHAIKSINDVPIDLLSRSIVARTLDLTEYFRRLGVQPQKQRTLKSVEQTNSPNEKILEYFKTRFGEIDDGSIEHVVAPWNGSTIAVHLIPIDLKSERSILFTVGLSDLTPSGVELMLGLPLDWPRLVASLESEASCWPIQWMFRIAKQLIECGEKLDRDWAILHNETWPDIIADGYPFSSWALCGGKEPIEGSGGSSCWRVLEMYALFNEERELAIRDGYMELLQRWMRLGVPEYLDKNRANAGL